MKAGNSNRAISATNMNEGSSRSHSIFILTVSQNNLNDLSVITIINRFYLKMFVLLYTKINLLIIDLYKGKTS